MCVNFLREYSEALIQRVELGDGLLALLHLGGASQESCPPGLKSLLSLPHSLVSSLASLVAGPLAGHTSAEILRNMIEQDVLLIKCIEQRNLQPI